MYLSNASVVQEHSLAAYRWLKVSHKATVKVLAGATVFKAQWREN